MGHGKGWARGLDDWDFGKGRERAGQCSTTSTPTPPSILFLRERVFSLRLGFKPYGMICAFLVVGS